MTTDPTTPGPTSPANQGAMGPGLPTEPATADEPTPGAPERAPDGGTQDEAERPQQTGEGVSAAERVAGVLGGAQRSLADVLTRLRGSDDVPRDYLIERLEHIERQLADVLGTSSRTP